MVFYFSGTGNSLWAAKKLSSAFGEQLVSIADELNESPSDFVYKLNRDEKVFFVFPVHSWGPAALAYRFVSKLKFEGYANQSVYVICTCGDNCGYTNKIIGKKLHRKGIRLTGSYSLQMPNNYVLMSGFSTDSKEVEQQKLKDAPNLLNNIIENIKSQSDEVIYTIGTSPFMKSNVVYPLFRKFALGRNQFYAKENCTSCGLCEKVCPTNTISLNNGKPQWKKTCVQCTACIHRCPAKAIEYGKISEGKGRYVHPEL